MFQTRGLRQRGRLDGRVLTERMAGKSTAARRFGRKTPIARAMSTRVEAFRIEAPTAGDVRVRNLVHRGAMRPVFKVPSIKLQRVVQCESLLEVDLAILLDASPFVSSYGEQPAIFHFVIDGERRWHVPDFQAQLSDRRIYIEVKFEEDIDDHVLARTALLQRQLEQQGAIYLLLTETDIRKPHRIANARQVLRRACHALTDLELIGSFERLRESREMTFRDWSWDRSRTVEAIALARLLVKGMANVDWSRPLTLETTVRAANGTEGEPWPLAPSR